MIKKKWKTIKYNGKKTNYKISNHGEIISTNYGNTKKQKKLKLSFDKNGYLVVRLHFEGKSKKFRVHRLVAETFIPIPKKYKHEGLTKDMLQINHIDGIHDNNIVTNLEWCTASENIAHAELNGLRKHRKGARHTMAK